MIKLPFSMVTGALFEKIPQANVNGLNTPNIIRMISEHASFPDCIVFIPPESALNAIVI
jgi:hypothetical protein